MWVKYKIFSYSRFLLFHNMPPLESSVPAPHFLAHCAACHGWGRQLCTGVTRRCLVSAATYLSLPALGSSERPSWYTCPCNLEVVRESTLLETTLQKGMGVCGFALHFFCPRAENSVVHSVRLTGPSQEMRWI